MDTWVRTLPGDICTDSNVLRITTRYLAMTVFSKEEKHIVAARSSRVGRNACLSIVISARDKSEANLIARSRTLFLDSLSNNRRFVWPMILDCTTRR
jgi:hypothetical protein